MFGDGPGVGSPGPVHDVFDEPARWRADALEALGMTGDDRIAAASPGALFPAALRSLAAGLGLGAGDLVVDLGGGLGGVAAWFGSRTGARVVLVEPAAGSALSARRLFGRLPVLRAVADAVPLATGRADAVLLVGVASLLDDIAPVLTEAHRVLRPGGRVGLTDLCSSSVAVDRRPPNTFRSLPHLIEALTDAGFSVGELAAGDPRATGPWQQTGGEVDELVRRRHAEERAFAQWAQDRAHLAEVIGSGAVTVGSLVARRC